MVTKNQHIAIILFSYSSLREAKRKNLSTEFGKNKDIISTFISHMKYVARKSKIDVFNWDEKKQKGVSFGEKIHHAFQSVFDLGYHSVIAIGNDCIELTAQDILNAQNKLLSEIAVLGPTVDGGAYLIGLTKTQFANTQIDLLPWETHTLYEEFLSHLVQKNISPHTIEYKWDINHPKTLRHVIRNSSHYFCGILRELLRIIHNAIYINNSKITSYLYLYYSLRAPPFAQ